MPTEEQLEERRQKKNAYDRERRAKRRAQGLCVTCGKNPVAPGLRYCAHHAELLREKTRRLRDRRVRRNQCRDCNRLRQPGRSYCKLHLNRHNKRTRKLYGTRKELKDAEQHN